MAKPKARTEESGVRVKLNVAPESTLGVPVGDQVLEITVDADCMAEVPPDAVPVLRDHRLIKE